MAELRWTPTEDDGRVRFVSSGFASVNADNLMDSLARFVEEVVNRLEEEGVAATALQTEWAAIQSADVEEQDFCRAVATLGLDPFDIDKSASQTIGTAFDQLNRVDFDVFMSPPTLTVWQTISSGSKRPNQFSVINRLIRRSSNIYQGCTNLKVTGAVRRGRSGTNLRRWLAKFSAGSIR